MDSVEATRLDTNFFGHDYFASNKDMIQELRQVIRERKPVEKRDQMHPEPGTVLLKYFESRPPS